MDRFIHDKWNLDKSSTSKSPLIKRLNQITYYQYTVLKQKYRTRSKFHRINVNTKNRVLKIFRRRKRKRKKEKKIFKKITCLHVLTVRRDVNVRGWVGKKRKVSWNAACVRVPRQGITNLRDKGHRVVEIGRIERERKRWGHEGEGKEKEGENALAQTAMQIFTRRASSFS